MNSKYWGNDQGFLAFLRRLRCAFVDHHIVRHPVLWWQQGGWWYLVYSRKKLLREYEESKF